MTEKIEVFYGSIHGTEFSHKYIVYTDSTGTKTRIDGGGTIEPANLNIALIMNRFTWGTFPFGALGLTVTPNYVPGTNKATRPRVLMALGDDLSAEWLQINQTASQISGFGAEYDFLLFNSNTMVDLALGQAGLGLPVTPAGIQAPGSLKTVGNGASFFDAPIERASMPNFTVRDYLNGGINTWAGTIKKIKQDSVGEKVHCFSAQTHILLPGNITLPISQLTEGQRVLAFDASKQSGRDVAIEASVVRLHAGFTTEWIEIEDGTRVTPGHRYLTPRGTFKPISDILADDGLVVAGDGIILKMSGSLIRAADAGSGAEWIESDPYIWGSTVLKASPIFGWRTYNLEVEGYHTYIAGGLRVHNDGCLRAGDSIADVAVDPVTGAITVVGIDQFGSALQVTRFVTGQAVRTETFGTQGAVVSTTWTEDANGQLSGEPVREVSFPGAVITGEQIGTIFGSSIGQAIAGNNIFAQVAAGSRWPRSSAMSGKPCTPSSRACARSPIPLPDRSPSSSPSMPPSAISGPTSSINSSNNRSTP